MPVLRRHQAAREDRQPGNYLLSRVLRKTHGDELSFTGCVRSSPACPPCSTGYLTVRRPRPPRCELSRMPVRVPKVETDTPPVPFDPAFDHDAVRSQLSRPRLELRALDAERKVRR